MKNAKRRMVLDRKIPLSIHDFDGLDIDGAVKHIDGFRSQIKLGETAVFEVDSYGYDGGVDMSLLIHRQETDAELEARLKEERALRERQRRNVKMQESREFEQYQRLKAKFEKAQS
jgi:hypothetical protein